MLVLHGEGQLVTWEAAVLPQKPPSELVRNWVGSLRVLLLGPALSAASLSLPGVNSVETNLAWVVFPIPGK